MHKLDCELFFYCSPVRLSSVSYPFQFLPSALTMCDSANANKYTPRIFVTHHDDYWLVSMSFTAVFTTMEISTYAGITVAVFLVIYLFAKKLGRKKNNKSAKAGTVVLHQFFPSELSVSGSPPCIKLETFLRMAKIPYVSVYGFNFSKKGKVPWIEWNGQEIADSNFCIQFLMKEFQVDIDSHLSATEKAIAHSVRTMLEENTYW